MADWRRSLLSRLRHVCRWTRIYHLDEPEVYAIYPQHIVIGCLRSDSRFAGNSTDGPVSARCLRLISGGCHTMLSEVETIRDKTLYQRAQ